MNLLLFNSFSLGVNIVSTGTTANQGDFYPFVNKVSFAAGNLEGKAIIHIINDGVSEALETIELAIDATMGYGNPVSPTTTIISILDEDSM